MKIIEGTIVNVPPHGGRKHPYQDFIKFDTSNVLFICAGSFEGKKNQTFNKLYKHICLEDISLVKKIVIKECDKYNIAMINTGIRHFLH